LNEKEGVNMPRTIEAIYEDGVLKPLDKIRFREHSKIRIILPAEAEEPAAEDETLDGIIDIAGDCTDSDLSVNHDKYLYGASED